MLRTIDVSITLKHLLSVQHTIFFTFNFINAKDVPCRTQQAHGGYHSRLQPLFSILPAVLTLCCYGKVLNFTIKNTRFTKKHYIANYRLLF